MVQKFSLLCLLFAVLGSSAIYPSTTDNAMSRKTQNMEVLKIMRGPERMLQHGAVQQQELRPLQSFQNHLKRISESAMPQMNTTEEFLKRLITGTLKKQPENTQLVGDRCSSRPKVVLLSICEQRCKRIWIDHGDRIEQFHDNTNSVQTLSTGDLLIQPQSQHRPVQLFDHQTSWFSELTQNRLIESNSGYTSTNDMKDDIDYDETLRLDDGTQKGNNRSVETEKQEGEEEKEKRRSLRRLIIEDGSALPNFPTLIFEPPSLEVAIKQRRREVKLANEKIPKLLEDEKRGRQRDPSKKFGEFTAKLNEFISTHSDIAVNRCNDKCQQTVHDLTDNLMENLTDQLNLMCQKVGFSNDQYRCRMSQYEMKELRRNLSETCAGVGEF